MKKEKLNYVERNSDKLSEKSLEHGGLKNIRIQFGSPYPDCQATIFMTCNDGHEAMMGVKSMISGNRIVKKVKLNILPRCGDHLNLNNTCGYKTWNGRCNCEDDKCNQKQI
jgi:hypothetical protein